MDSFFDYFWYIYSISALLVAGMWIYALSNPLMRAFIESEIPDERMLTVGTSFTIFFPVLNTAVALGIIHSIFSRKR